MIEMSRPLPLHRIGPEGLQMRVEATPAECEALTTRMQIPAVQSLVCDFTLNRRGGDSAIVGDGELTARVTQTCVVTLDDFDATVTEQFRVIFVPEGTEKQDPDPDDDDEIPYSGDVLDLGEAAAEQLALALDPYPRKPGAELPDTATDEEAHPFAALAQIRKQTP